MNHLTLEQELWQEVKKRRMINAAICMVSLAVVIGCWIAYESSKVIEQIGSGFLSYQHVTYNTNWLWGILIGVLPLIYTVIFLICDFLFTIIASIEVNGSFVTLYRGFSHVNLYVNGVCKDSLFLFGYHMEATLPDGTKVNAALGKWSAHLTFSNGYPAVDIYPGHTD